MSSLAVNFCRSVIIAELWRPEVARPGNFVSNFCGFFGKKTTSCGKSFKILFRKFTRRHRLPLLCSNVVKFVWLEIGKIVRYSRDLKIRLPFKLSLRRESLPKSVRASLQHLDHTIPNFIQIGWLSAKSNAWRPFFWPREYMHDSLRIHSRRILSSGTPFRGIHVGNEPSFSYYVQLILTLVPSNGCLSFRERKSHVIRMRSALSRPYTGDCALIG